MLKAVRRWPENGYDRCRKLCFYSIHADLLTRSLHRIAQSFGKYFFCSVHLVRLITLSNNSSSLALPSIRHSRIDLQHSINLVHRCCISKQYRQVYIESQLNDMKTNTRNSSRSYALGVDPSRNYVLGTHISRLNGYNG